MAAGGIGSGESILAAMTLGADGVQIGTRFCIDRRKFGTFHIQGPLSAAE